MSKNVKKAVSWILSVIFSLAIFCSATFIIVHSEHHCTGRDCSVCMELAECHKTLHTLGTAVTGALLPTLMLLIMAVLIRIVIKLYTAHITLISLKVELLN